MGIIESLKQESQVPVIIADQDGLITYVNAKFEAIFKWTLAEIKGRPITTIIPPRLRDAHHLGFSRFLLTGQETLLNKPIPLMAVNKAGQEFNAVHTIVAEKINGQWVFGATVVPEHTP